MTIQLGYKQTQEIAFIRYTFGLSFRTWWFSGKEPAYQWWRRDVGLTPGLERYPLRGQGISLQYSFLENPMVRGAQRATVHGVTESDVTEVT